MAEKAVDKIVWRIMDANLNRCREGLRVLEDSARFLWNDKKLFECLRKERHGLDKILHSFYPELIKFRDSGDDEGRYIPEKGRGNIGNVIAANFRRCEESLRVLEEYGKLYEEGMARGFKRIRFRMYDLEKGVQDKLNHASKRR